MIKHVILKRPCLKHGIEITDCDKIMGNNKKVVCDNCVKETKSLKNAKGSTLDRGIKLLSNLSHSKPKLTRLSTN